MPMPRKCKVLLYQLHLTFIVNTVLYELHGSSLSMQTADFEMGSYLRDFDAGAAVVGLMKGSDLFQCCGNCQ